MRAIFTRKACYKSADPDKQTLNEFYESFYALFSLTWHSPASPR
jgi:hypothetical protein